MAAKIGIPWLRISIHALREEGDVDSVIIIYRSVIFYPRPPRVGRRRDHQNAGFEIYFYPRPGGRPAAQKLCFVIILSTPSARRAT